MLEVQRMRSEILQSIGNLLCGNIKMKLVDILFYDQRFSGFLSFGFIYFFLLSVS